MGASAASSRSARVTKAPCCCQLDAWTAVPMPEAAVTGATGDAARSADSGVATSPTAGIAAAAAELGEVKRYSPGPATESGLSIMAYSPCMALWGVGLPGLTGGVPMGEEATAAKRLARLVLRTGCCMRGES